MKILLLADNFPPERNAVASRVFERAVYWARWGHQVTIVTSVPNFPEGQIFPGYKNRFQVETISGIRVIRVKTFVAANTGTIVRIADFLSYMLMAAIRAALEPKADVIIGSSPQFFAAVAAWITSRIRGTRFVFELADLWPDSVIAVGAMKQNFILKVAGKFELFLYRQSAIVVALTPAFKDNLVRRGIPSEKVAVVINGADVERYKPQSRDRALARDWGIAENDFVIGYIGTYGMAHALSNVLQAAAILQGRSRVRYLFVGTGAQKDCLINECRKLQLKNVTFIPAQPKERMPAFWSLCDVALVHLKNNPVFKTVIPSKMFEAMAMGLPILLAAPEGEAKRILDAEGVGPWVPPEDAAKLAEISIALSEDDAHLRALAATSLAAAPKYTRERQARDMIAAIQSAMLR